MLCGCEDNGISAGDFVIKLRGGVERGESGMQCELVANRLAACFGLAVPDIALVTIEADFAELVAQNQPARTARVRESVGLNFATRQLTDVTTWPVDRQIPEAMFQAAIDVFAFDALIQNPDRRTGNPNLLTRGDTVFIYDHELSFSFLLGILPSETPWNLEDQPYLNDHVFYSKLKEQPIDLQEFTAALVALRGEQLERIIANAPEEWNNENLPRIEGHLRAVSEHAEEFAQGVRRRLA